MYEQYILCTYSHTMYTFEKNKKEKERLLLVQAKKE